MKEGGKRAVQEDSAAVFVSLILGLSEAQLQSCPSSALATPGPFQ